jgi:hypothetical protein
MMFSSWLKFSAHEPDNDVGRSRHPDEPSRPCLQVMNFVPSKLQSRLSCPFKPVAIELKENVATPAAEGPMSVIHALSSRVNLAFRAI